MIVVQYQTLTIFSDSGFVFGLKINNYKQYLTFNVAHSLEHFTIWFGNIYSDMFHNMLHGLYQSHLW